MLPSIQNSKRKGYNQRKHIIKNHFQEHSARIDDNPKIIHIDERRMNMNLFVDESNPPSMYELLRAWVEDDPERYNDYIKKPKLSHDDSSAALNQSLKLEAGSFSVEINNNDSELIAMGSPLMPEEIEKLEDSRKRIRNSMSECVASPSELLQRHVRRFRDIKEKSIAASVMKNNEAMVLINSLRDLE